MAALRALRTMRDRRMGRLPLYEEIAPSSSWTDDSDPRSLVIDLPEFKREEVKLQIDDSGNVTIKGTHDIGNNRFKRFTKTVKSPESTDINRIAGELNGALYTVVFPKMVTSAADEAKAVENDEGIAAGEGVVEETKPEQDRFGARTDEGQETIQQTEAVSKMTEQTAAEKFETLTETAEKELETVTMVAETMTKTTTTITETAAQEANTTTKTLEAVQETETLEEKTTTETEDAATVVTENVMKPAEPALYVLDSTVKSETAALLKADENVTTTTTDSSPEVSETENSSNGSETAMEATATKALLEAYTNAKPVGKDEPQEQEHEGVPDGAGLMQSVIEMISEHKTCILSSILAFSIGILISRKFNS